ncbi:hypothetical protein [Halorubrum saccharovorum]|uniref:hypothetical protein n=1 Tax=Halorubrum saccharovorum TaxID=2248 RepID=UPI001F1EE283|nr:hypothetical protein [Halorubrum saccharovorum]
MPSESSTAIDETQSSADRDRGADSAGDSAALPDADPDMAPVEWGPVRFERLRSLAFGASATVGVLVLAALLFVAAGIVVSVIGGGTSLFGGGGPPASTWALLVLLLVGGPMSLFYWIVAYDQTSPERRRELRSQFGDYSFDLSGLRLGWTLAGAGAVVAVGVAAMGPGPFPETLSVFSRSRRYSSRSPRSSQ